MPLISLEVAWLLLGGGGGAYICGTLRYAIYILFQEYRAVEVSCQHWISAKYNLPKTNRKRSKGSQSLSVGSTYRR